MFPLVFLWLTSLKTILSRLIHITANCMTLCFLLPIGISLCMYHNFFISSFAFEPLVCCQFFTIINSASMCIVQMYFLIVLLDDWGILWREGWLGHIPIIDIYPQDTKALIISPFYKKISMETIQIKNKEIKDKEIVVYIQ